MHQPTIRRLALCGVIAITVPARLDTSQRQPVGEWGGTYSTQESGGTIRLQIDSTSTGWTARVLATSEYVANPQFQNAANVTIGGDSIAFELTWGTPVRWSGRVRGDSIKGTMSTDHWNGTWVATRKRSTP